jgi:hypothetical protein
MKVVFTCDAARAVTTAYLDCARRVPFEKATYKVRTELVGEGMSYEMGIASRTGPNAAFYFDVVRRVP